MEHSSENTSLTDTIKIMTSSRTSEPLIPLTEAMLDNVMYDGCFV
jgi:hypothetical protein